MPKSRVRNKPAYTPPQTRSAKHLPGKPWVGPAMAVFFVLGVAWLVAYYLTNGDVPVPGIGPWNMAIGFGFICVGFGLSTQWR